MNDFLTKLLLEDEQKGVILLEEKKKSGRKEIFYDFNEDLDERITRYAMSQYQEDKSHHKRSSNYGDLNQWDYRNQQDTQNANSHNRRGHFPFGGSSQSHPVGWNPLGIGLPRQANPYYSSPHSHMIPAHAHAEYRYNQWNNPNQKSVPNIQNAHSQNAILPQSRMDGKHRTDISNSLTDFGLSAGPTADFSKLRSNHRDIMLRGQAVDKTAHLATISSVTRNPGSRTPTLATHPKTMIGNPLSDLQMLVTNQENNGPAQKSSCYQQESVDLSAHSDISKNKDNSLRKDDKSMNENNIDRTEHRPICSITQTQNKPVVSRASDTCDKPVELTSKNNENITRTDNSISSVRLSKLENNCSTDAKAVDHKSEKEVTKINKNQVDKLELARDRIANTIKNDENLSDNIKGEKFIPKNDESSIMDLNRKQEAERNAIEDTNKVAGGKDDEIDISESLTIKKENKDSESTNSFTDELTQNMKRKSLNDQPVSESKKTCMDNESQVQETNEIKEENSDLPTVSSTSAEVKPLFSDSCKKSPKRKPPRKSRGLRLSSVQSSSSESQFYNKKIGCPPNRDDIRKKMKKNLCDTVDRRGPFLHLEGSKESPSSVTVINYPKGDDEDEKDKSAAKKQMLNSNRPKHHNELDYRGKSKNGLFSSTLSCRYDAHTTDHTWVCVFCKKGPHYNTLGDLFGPYIVSKEENNGFMGDFSGDEKDISDAQKRGGRNKKSLRSNNMVEHFQKMSKKLRRTQPTDSSLVGMTVISDDLTDQTRYEVWVHEQCAIWSPNVCLIGSRIIGMQEAIWSSVKTMCSKCGAFGANIGCVFRNCPNRSHYHCAKENEWSLEQETFISTCHIHKPRS